MRLIFFVFGVGIVAGGMIGFVTGYVDPSATRADGQTVELDRRVAVLTANAEAQNRRRATEDRFNIRVVGSAEPFKYLVRGYVFSGNTVDRQKLLDLLPTLLDELDRYPDRVIDSIKLHRIVVCTGFALAGKPEGGVTDPATGTIYLGADWFETNKTDFRQAVHHEMFHLIDYAAGTMGAADPAWSAANPKGFRYGTGGLNATTENSSGEISSAAPGFISAYARSGIEEDKAEVYGWLMGDPAAVRARARADPALAVKVRRLRAIASGFNYKLGEMLPVFVDGSK